MGASPSSFSVCAHAAWHLEKGSHLKAGLKQSAVCCLNFDLRGPPVICNLSYPRLSLTEENSSHLFQIQSNKAFAERGVHSQGRASNMKFILTSQRMELEGTMKTEVKFHPRFSCVEKKTETLSTMTVPIFQCKVTLLCPICVCFY